MGSRMEQMRKEAAVKLEEAKQKAEDEFQRLKEAREAEAAAKAAAAAAEARESGAGGAGALAKRRATWTSSNNLDMSKLGDKFKK